MMIKLCSTNIGTLLPDRYDNVEQLTGEEDVGVSVELVVHELEEVG